MSKAVQAKACSSCAVKPACLCSCCSYLGEALRALLVLEVRQLALDGRQPCERVPAHLPAGAAAARCSVRSACGAHATVVLGGPPSGAPPCPAFAGVDTLKTLETQTPFGIAAPLRWAPTWSGCPCCVRDPLGLCQCCALAPQKHAWCFCARRVRMLGSVRVAFKKCTNANALVQDALQHRLPDMCRLVNELACPPVH